MADESLAPERTDLALRVAELEASLAEARSRTHLLDLILASTGDAIYGVDLDGRCTFCNQAFLEILGYANAAEVLGRHTHQLIHHTRPDGQQYPMSECRGYEVMTGRTSVYVEDELFFRADGTSVEVEYRARPILENGRITGAVMSFADISERKRLEREREALIARLQRSIEEIQSLRSLLPVCAWCGRIRDESDQWLRLETYMERHGSRVTHGICEHCVDHMLPSGGVGENEDPTPQP